MDPTTLIQTLNTKAHFAQLMEVPTGRECSYLQWCSLGLAGVNCSLIRCRWDLWEEELFSFVPSFPHTTQFQHKNSDPAAAAAATTSHQGTSYCTL